MDLGKQTKEKTFITAGLDIGSYSVKYAEVSWDEKGASLLSAQIHRTGASSSDQLKAVLKNLLGASSSPAKRVRISVSGPAVLIRNVTLPRMTPQELKSAIRFEAERHIPFHVDDCVLDYQVLGQTANKVSMKLLLVAAKKELINQRIKLLSEIGLQPDIIDADILSFANAYAYLNDSPDIKTYGLLNIGHEVSSFAIIRNGELFFVREMLSGGRQVTKALTELRNVSEEAADELKKKNDPEHASERILATQKGFGSLADEIKRSIDYFENEAGEELSVIFAAGGGSKSEKSAEFLSEELGKKVVLWNGTNKLLLGEGADPTFTRDHLPELHVSYGLAIRKKSKNQ